MDRNLNNKVYINPNFKRPDQTHNAWPVLYPDTPNYYQCFSQEMHNYKLIMENNSSRRIYVNPNFKQVKQENKSYSMSHETYEKNENIKSSPKLISKSKYSLVANITKNEVDERRNCREDKPHNSMNTMHKTDFLCHQNISAQKVLNDGFKKEVPIIKSRYTIVRKNKVLSKDKEDIELQNLKKEVGCNLQENSIRISNFDTCYINKGSSILKNHENNRSENKPSEKIAKIKITKYKTVPITYLKKNLSPIKPKEYKSNSTVLQFHTNAAKQNRLEFLCNNDRYKLIRSISKPVDNINPSKQYINSINKSVSNKIRSFKANFKLNNIPCRLFTKYGKCLRKDYGKCEYLHDKKHVSLCRKFLKGICHDINCPLSHELTANKMPTCYFYLKGICTKENCPYLHIKLNEKINICPNFLKGYCEKGYTCKYRHVKVNPFKKSKIFNSSNRVQNKSTKLTKNKTKSIQKKNMKPLSNKRDIPQTEEQNNVECRYYKEMVSNEEICKNIKPTRCKIGTLPSFIQL